MLAAPVGFSGIGQIETVATIWPDAAGGVGDGTQE
jgi:hypothetical protein